MNILITGGAGFIGSNFIPYYLEKNPNDTVINLDLLTYAGNLENLSEINNEARYKFIQGSICDGKLVESIFEEFDIQSVINFAAESHVDNSISSPYSFIKTNIEGTFVLLEAAKKYWLNSSNNRDIEYKNSRFHHISTDEVYGSLENDGYFTEDSPYAPNSPYSASKASSDFLVRSYYHTYGLPVITTNCSNNYGPKQHDEKLIPTIIRKAIKNEAIPIYGKGDNIRDWLYVLDHCSGIERAFKNGNLGETYVIGGNNEYSNIDIAKKICSLLDEVQPKKIGSYKDQISFVMDRLGHDFRYAIDAKKIKRELGWTPQFNIDEGLRTTISWYLNKYNK
ncbi:dTDP-glucose 4,6-dehydratase [Cellulophaga baltica]|uniref:dTDP-glucose 4,6-dehydratase n=1 Tax=Cellulophaga baltica 18 TaxID=1348584 RepID=A0AAU8RBE2_9FLAO|nr:dTDP-glucose 4,6-dehydratase [Cellulophaga baltica]AIZ41081.1 spore coat protein [Cellulophaga baltica 18]WFO14921.1 dTDP-glucose 4,6-dehydratase [Cellulophaga baltica 4]